jgi:hypothetical protein
LLVAAVCLFVRGQPFPAAVCAVLSATFHSTYLLPAGLLTLGFLTALVLESRSRQALALGALSFALVLPVMVHVLTRFGPTSPETFAEAQRILVNVRIPHHTQPAIWLDWIGGLQVGWMALGILLARPLRLRVSLAVPFALSALLTLAQVATGSDTLALLFPWRVSSVLMPITTTVILSRLAAVPVPQLNGLAARGASGVAILALGVAGLWLLAARQGFHSPADELPLLDYVRQNKAAGDVYFLPVEATPTPPKHSGSLSTDFMPVRAKQSDGRPIPVNLQRFRLYTGAPIYVDFKSVPYKDSEVIEWHTRFRQAENWQRQLKETLPVLSTSTAGLIWSPLGQGPLLAASTLSPQTVLQERQWSATLAELRRLGVTHLIVQPGQGPPPLGAEPLFGDSNYLLYRLNTPPSVD